MRKERPGEGRKAEREKRQTQRGRAIATVTTATPTTPLYSAEMECGFALISILGDFGINHRHTHIDLILFKEEGVTCWKFCACN